jgi:nucleoid-associated protein YgaU
MPNRYEHSFLIPNARKVESDGTVKTVRRISTIMYPSNISNEETKILSQEGDRLDLLAKEFYGDETLWFIIAKANGLGKGSLNVPAGQVIKIPIYQEYSGVSVLLNQVNRER